MPRWTVTFGDILDVAAHVLVCSANPYLTLSGGVGGAFQLRYGAEMQEYLHLYHLARRGFRHVPPGTVVDAPPCGSPYAAVLHAVAVDASYNSSPQLITTVVERILTVTEQLNCDSLALPALATGYGKLPMEQFVEGLRPAMDRESRVESVVLCLRRKSDADHVRRLLGVPHAAAGSESPRARGHEPV